jgi:hypothetical protein
MPGRPLVLGPHLSHSSSCICWLNCDRLKDEGRIESGTCLPPYTLVVLHESGKSRQSSIRFYQLDPQRSYFLWCSQEEELDT